MTTSAARRLLDLQGSQALVDAFLARAERRWGPAPGEDDWGSWAEAILVAVQLAGHREDVQLALLELLRRAALPSPTVGIDTATAALAAARLVDWPKDRAAQLRRLLVLLSTAVVRRTSAEAMFKPDHHGLSCFAVELARTVRREPRHEWALEQFAIETARKLQRALLSPRGAPSESALLRDGRRALHELLSTLPETAVKARSTLLRTLATIRHAEELWAKGTVLYRAASEPASKASVQPSVSATERTARIGPTAQEVDVRSVLRRLIKPQNQGYKGESWTNTSLANALLGTSADDT